MKKIRFILGLALLFPVMTGCEDSEDENAKYTVTFHQEGAQDVSVEFDKSTKQSEVEIKEPTLLAKEGYEVNWEDYSIDGKTSSFVVNAIYSPITYYVNFKVQGTLLEAVPFTIKDINGEHSQLPSYKVPTLPEYSWSEPYWEDYSLSLNNIEVNAMFDELKTFTLKFVAKGNQLGSTITYTKNDLDSEGKIRHDLIPQAVFDYKLENYEVVWDFTIEEGKDLIIQPQLTPHSYYLKFVDFDGKQIGEKVPYNFLSTWASVNKPSAPELEGYNTSWGDVVLTYSDVVQVVEPFKTGKEYHVSFDGLDDTQTVTFGESYDLNHKSSITSTWKAGDVVISDGGIWSYPNDATLVSQKVNRKNFNGAVPLFVDESKSTNISSIEIASGAGLNSSDALKIKVNESKDFGVYFAKEALDEVFADSSVECINIVAKSNIQNNNFRHRTGNVASCYEVNSSKYGINLEYKSFSFTREMYSNHNDSTDFIIFGGAGGTSESPVSCAGQEIYIDSLIFNGKNAVGYGRDSFEDGYIESRKVDSSNIEVRYYHSYDLTPDAQVGSGFMVRYSSTAVTQFTPSFNFDHVTEGIRSMAFTKSTGYVALYLSPTFWAKVQESASKKFAFDFWSECAINSTSAVKNLQDGKGHVFNNQHPAQQFVTFELTAIFKPESTVASTKTTNDSAITDDGRFFIIQGGTPGLMCFDNFRIVD